MFGSTAKRFIRGGKQGKDVPGPGRYKGVKSDFRNKYRKRKRVKVSFKQILRSQGGAKNLGFRSKHGDTHTKKLIGKLSKLVNLDKPTH